jgi:hypothetical protein
VRNDTKGDKEHKTHSLLTDARFKQMMTRTAHCCRLHDRGLTPPPSPTARSTTRPIHQEVDTPTSDVDPELKTIPHILQVHQENGKKT